LRETARETERERSTVRGTERALAKRLRFRTRAMQVSMAKAAAAADTPPMVQEQKAPRHVVPPNVRIARASAASELALPRTMVETKVNKTPRPSRPIAFEEKQKLERIQTAGSGLPKQHGKEKMESSDRI
jgi:hypothetical protein